MTTNSKSPWRFLGFIIWPILDDETEEILFYEVMPPCGCPSVPGVVGCDCASAGEPIDTCHTAEEAREFVRTLRAFRKTFGVSLFAD
jgi:hypothetical protein